MDEKLLKKRLRGKVAMHMLFGLGGAVVIIGALFKILHLEIGPITRRSGLFRLCLILSSEIE
jgi:hypothetical protein